MFCMMRTWENVVVLSQRYTSRPSDRLMKTAVVLYSALAGASSKTACGFVLHPTRGGCHAGQIGDGSGTHHALRRSSSVGTPSSTQQNIPLGEKRPDREFISILSEDGTEQMLPMDSASRFPMWVIDGGGAGGDKRVVEVPGASSETGWVNPRSYGELWVPEGSPMPTMKLCLGMLMKDGVPRYVMPVVDLVVIKGGQKWRNRGLNTVPSAHCWETVGRVAAGLVSVSAYVEEKVEGSETDTIWGTLAEKVSIAEAFTGIVNVLADPPEDLHLESGFHFLVAEIKGVGGSLPVPSCGGRVRMFLSDVSEPAQLLEIPDVRGIAELNFEVVSVASGAESEFLPDVYRAFFVPETTA